MAKAPTAQWDIYRIKGASQAYLGSVEASDEQEAVEKAAKQFNVSARSRTDW